MYYFAYGSNMNLEHMRRLCGWHAHLIGRALLDNFELGVDSRGYGNILPRPGKKVWGLLFDLDQHALDSLDEFEGYPEGFDRWEVQVIEGNKESRKAWVYIEPKETFGSKTPAKAEYWQRVIAGAKAGNLPEEWIKNLEALIA
jgi:gamma-glutamylcyclotransferase